MTEVLRKILPLSALTRAVTPDDIQSNAALSTDPLAELHSLGQAYTTGHELATDILALLPHASARVAERCAELLVATNYMTSNLAFAFIARADASTCIALAGARGLPRAMLLHRVLTGSLEEARAIASRIDLDPLTLAGLADRNDPLIDRMIAESDELFHAPAVIDRLSFRAQQDGRLAALLLDRRELSFAQRARLFEFAAPWQRDLLMEEAECEDDKNNQYVVESQLLKDPILAALKRKDRNDIRLMLQARLGSKQKCMRSVLDHCDGALVAIICRALDFDDATIRQILVVMGADAIKMMRPGGAEDVLEHLSSRGAKRLIAAMTSESDQARLMTHQNEANAITNRRPSYKEAAPLEWMDKVA